MSIAEGPLADGAIRGVVFNIQRYSLHDGNGIRTMVFLKGCPLRCRWCGNPESQARHPQLARNELRCLGTEICDLCAGACPTGALRQPP
ncbi:MAG TPA: 4Fe-4S cluster-binding domain-containing protein, partial [Rhodospirillaceae bacterium]|nr:4Fe-4S cluster-binding domain-containing protein [Rhodospirillaceae bacterium]